MEDRTIKRRRWFKKVRYQLADPIVATYLAGLRRTARLEEHEHYAVIHELIERQQPFIPCYWHQQSLLCAIYLLDLKMKRDFKLGFLISPSRDGDIPARLFSRWGAHVIRGSSSRTGAQAMRELYLAVARGRISPSNTPDGPRGPRFESKTGPLMLAQMTQAPIVPMAAAANSYRQLNSWDRFIVPKWRARVAVVVGTPITVERKVPTTDLEPLRQVLQAQLNSLTETAWNIVKG